VIPLKDENPTRTFAAVTVLIIAVCAYVYFFVQPAGQLQVAQRGQQSRTSQEYVFDIEHAAIPCEIVRDRPMSTEELNSQQCESHPTQPPFDKGKNVYLAILYSMFLHGSLLHIGGNMLFLWIFGNNIEDSLGHVGYTVFYLVAGVVATFAQVALSPMSTVPMIGASGAIAGVMGMYLVLFPDAPINTLFLFVPFVFFRKISAKWLLSFWLLSQFFLSPGSGVAWMAHVGGFLFGCLVGLLGRSRWRPKPVIRAAY
jgi:membrane associated rhomboid family serine protease